MGRGPHDVSEVGVVGPGRGPAEMEPLRTDNKPDTGNEGGVPAPANGRTGVLSPARTVSRGWGQGEGHGWLWAAHSMKWERPAGHQEGWPGVQVRLKLDRTDWGIVPLSPKPSTGPSQALPWRPAPDPHLEVTSILSWVSLGGLPQAGLVILCHFSTPTQDSGPQPQGHFPREASPRLGPRCPLHSPVHT